MHINKIRHEYPGFKLDVSNILLKSNRIIGLVGRNGAGKTTLMNILSGYQKANVEFDVEGIKSDMVVYVPSDLELYEYLTVNEFVLFVVKYSKTSLTPDELISRLGLTDKKDMEISSLSQGMKKKLTLINLFCDRHDLIILDEPFNSIDVMYISELKEIILKLKKESTILISSHILDILENLCDDFVYIKDGEIQKQCLNEHKNGTLGGELFE